MAASTPKHCSYRSSWGPTRASPSTSARSPRGMPTAVGSTMHVLKQLHTAGLRTLMHEHMPLLSYPCTCLSCCSRLTVPSWRTYRSTSRRMWGTAVPHVRTVRSGRRGGDVRQPWSRGGVPHARAAQVGHPRGAHCRLYGQQRQEEHGL